MRSARLRDRERIKMLASAYINREEPNTVIECPIITRAIIGEVVRLQELARTTLVLNSRYKPGTKIILVAASELT